MILQKRTLADAKLASEVGVESGRGYIHLSACLSLCIYISFDRSIYSYISMYLYTLAGAELASEVGVESNQGSTPDAHECGDRLTVKINNACSQAGRA